MTRERFLQSLQQKAHGDRTTHGEALVSGAHGIRLAAVGAANIPRAEGAGGDGPSCRRVRPSRLQGSAATLGRAELVQQRCAPAFTRERERDTGSVRGTQAGSLVATRAVTSRGATVQPHVELRRRAEDRSPTKPKEKRKRTV